MVNCYLCGRSDRTSDLIEAVGGVTLHLGNRNVDLFDGQFFCEDIEDCENEVESHKFDYPEEIEDTPCLDEPWWVYR